MKQHIQLVCTVCETPVLAKVDGLGKFQDLFLASPEWHAHLETCNGAIQDDLEYVTGM